MARYSQGTSTEVLLTIYEFSTEEWVLDDGNLLSAWATGVPRVDGIFVCYDASDLKSFNHVVDILGECPALCSQPSRVPESRRRSWLSSS